MESEPRTWITTLRNSHERLIGLVQPMTPEQLRDQSYCRDWTIAQVLSHLGSGAEIALMMLPGALGRSEHASRDAFPAVWDRWNAMSPDEQAATALATDEEHVSTLEQLSDEELAAMSMPFFGMDLDAAGIIRLRLGEHSLHTWDIAVTSDPAAAVAPDAAALLIDNVPQFLAPRLGKPQDPPFEARIRTSHPDRDYLLSAGEPVSMTDWPDAGADAGAVAEISLPAEALLRLSYGRLDAEHTPASVVGSPADLDRLRAIFPGF